MRLLFGYWKQLICKKISISIILLNRYVIWICTIFIRFWRETYVMLANISSFNFHLRFLDEGTRFESVGQTMMPTSADCCLRVCQKILMVGVRLYWGNCWHGFGRIVRFAVLLSWLWSHSVRWLGRSLYLILSDFVPVCFISRSSCNDCFPSVLLHYEIVQTMMVRCARRQVISPGAIIGFPSMKVGYLT